MSWKSIVITGLLCVVAAPAFAAPGLVVDLVRSGGTPVLDALGNWQWRVSVDPDETLFVNSGPTGTPPNTLGGSMAIEIGMTFTGAPIVTAVVNTANFDHENFGNSPFAFGENPADGLTVVGNQLFAALGSTFFSSGALQEVMTITTAGPSTVGPNLTTNVSWLGDYTGMARIAQNGVNTDTFSGTINKTVLGGDANFTGAVNGADVNILGLHFNQAGFKIWTNGDFNDTNTVNGADVNILGLNFNGAPIPPPGGGSGGVAVPEPASVVLALLAACAVSFGGRRRQ